MRSLVFDPNDLVSRLGGDVALAREAAAIFVQEAPGMVARIRESLQAASATELCWSAHALKGSASNFSERGAAATAARLEQVAKGGALAEAPALVRALEVEVADLVVALDAFRNG